MTRRDLENKNAVIRFMAATALANGKPGKITDFVRLAERLHRLEATLSRLAEDECNYPVYDAEKQERIEKLAKKLIASQIGCECYTQRDPRGYCIRMYLQDETGRPWFNNFDGETTCLNW